MIDATMFRFIDSPDLFPATIHHVSAAFHPDLWITVPPEEAKVCRSALGTAVQRRRSEYVAGRRCAARALDLCLGHGPLGIDAVGRRVDRSPIWPPGTVGSITHTEGYAAAAVASCDRVRSIGIDSEVLLHTEQATELAPFIGSHEELSRAASAFDGSNTIGFTVLFSAKESLFKCLFPIVSVLFDFLDVQLIDIHSDEMTIGLKVTLDAEFTPGWRATGSIRPDLPYVHTGFVLPRDARLCREAAR